MPKVKTNCAAKKRFKLTASGIIKRKHADKSHILTKKTTKRKRNLRYFGVVEGANQQAIKELLVLK